MPDKSPRSAPKLAGDNANSIPLVKIELSDASISALLSKKSSGIKEENKRTKRSKRKECI
jgi:hypothetical protein